MTDLSLLLAAEAYLQHHDKEDVSDVNEDDETLFNWSNFNYDDTIRNNEDIQYGCEVLTFGRANHCALGGVI